jgi:hypothetical protein
MYAWRDDFSRIATAIKENHPDCFAEAASTSGTTALIKFSGAIPADAQVTINNFQAKNPNLTITTHTKRSPRTPMWDTTKVNTWRP